MNQMKVDKDFDCLEFKQQTQEKIAQDIKSLSPQEQIQYFRQKADSGFLALWWKNIKSQSELRHG